jgi:hypothetical protein
MAVYTASPVVKTLTVHKDHCRFIPREKLRPCGCGDTGQTGSQRWYCETHMNTNLVNEYMNGKYWAILVCDVCFREG